MRSMALWIGLATALPLMAQTASSSQTDLTAPPLLNNLSASPDDSNLVQAAKRTVLYRRAVYSKGPVWHIDDSMVGHSLLHQGASAGNSAGLPGSYGNDYTQGTTSAATISTATGANRADLEKRREHLQQEMARMVDENDQPYGGDVSEDEVNQRLNTLPLQIQTIDQRLQQSSQQSSPPPQ